MLLRMNLGGEKAKPKPLLLSLPVTRKMAKPVLKVTLPLGRKKLDTGEVVTLEEHALLEYYAALKTHRTNISKREATRTQEEKLERAKKMLKIAEGGSAAEDGAKAAFILPGGTKVLPENVVERAFPQTAPQINVPAGNTSIWVGSLPQHFTAETLFEEFSKFGKLVSIRPFFNQRFAILDYGDPRHAEQAINVMNNAFIKGSRIKVNAHRERDSKEKHQQEKQQQHQQRKQMILQHRAQLRGGLGLQYNVGGARDEGRPGPGASQQSDSGQFTAGSDSGGGGGDYMLGSSYLSGRFTSSGMSDAEQSTGTSTSTSSSPALSAASAGPDGYHPGLDGPFYSDSHAGTEFSAPAYSSATQDSTANPYAELDGDSTGGNGSNSSNGGKDNGNGDADDDDNTWGVRAPDSDERAKTAATQPRQDEDQDYNPNQARTMVTYSDDI